METILLINNDELFLDSMHTVLEQAGYAVETMHDAEDVEAYAEQHPPQLIILDALLHNMNGFELCQGLKQNPRLAQIPILLTSAIYLSEDDLRCGIRFGATTYPILADRCIMKPFEPAELLQQIRYGLGHDHERPYVPTLLIVDDEISIRELLKTTLQKQNYTIWDAETGQACLQCLRSHMPDLILLDYKLPDLSGIDVLKVIRSTLPRVAVILMTAYGDETIAIDAITEHVDGYLRKPFVVETLFSVVAQSLESVRSERERHRLVAQLRESNRELMFHYEQLEHANHELRAVDLLKSEFLANVGHELRTPLNSIIGFTELLLQGYSGELNRDQRRQLSMVLNSGHQLLSVLNDVIEVSMLNAGQVELKCEYLPISMVIEETVQDMQSMAEKKHLTLAMELPPALPLCFCSHEKVRLILHNLLDNAIKFSSSGTITIAAQSGMSLTGGHLPVSMRSAEISGDQEDLKQRYLLISVRDQGIGIRREDFEILFNEFRQIDGSLTRQYSGTGLGLAISKKLVELHKGTIWVESQVGAGSTFYFTLPTSHE